MIDSNLFNAEYKQEKKQLHNNDKSKKIGEIFSIFSNAHPPQKLLVLKEMVLQQYVTITAFAKVLETDKSQASKILSGHYIPKKISTIQKIADALHVNVILLTQLFKDLENLQGNENEKI